MKEQSEDSPETQLERLREAEENLNQRRDAVRKDAEAIVRAEVERIYGLKPGVVVEWTMKKRRGGSGYGYSRLNVTYEDITKRLVVTSVHELYKMRVPTSCPSVTGREITKSGKPSKAERMLSSYDKFKVIGEMNPETFEVTEYPAKEAETSNESKSE